MSKELKSSVLAHFIAETEPENIPQAVRQKAIRHILDSIGAGIAGAIAPETQIALKTLHSLGHHGGLSVLWGLAENQSPTNAAFINGIASHSFELDDTGGCDHSGAVVLPAAVAALDIAKQHGKTVSGGKFVTAVILGYDVARRALESCGAYAPHNKAGFHSTGTCGTFGAAAASAYIMELNPKQIQMALGLAGSFSSGLWACVHDGAQSKRLHAGHAAMGGLMASCLACNDFTGPSQIFEQVWGGFDHTFAPTSDVPDAWTAELGQNWKINRVSIKPHASCRSTHSSIDAVDLIRSSLNFNADDVEAVDIVINPFVHGMCGAFANNPMPSAQLSIPYSVAADIVLGNASLPAFARSVRNDSKIKAMMGRIHFQIDPSLPDLDEPVVTVTLKNGQSDTRKVDVPLGAPTNPISDEQLLKKFNSVVSMVFDQTTTDELANTLLQIESFDNIIDVLCPLLGKEPINRDLFDF